MMKIVGGILGLLVVGAGGFWFTMVRAPSAQEVCAHIGDLAEKEGLPEAALAELTMECPSNMKKGSLEGAIPYAKRMKCALDAPSLAALESCD